MSLLKSPAPRIPRIHSRIPAGGAVPRIPTHSRRWYELTPYAFIACALLVAAAAVLGLAMWGLS